MLRKIYWNWRINCLEKNFSMNVLETESKLAQFWKMSQKKILDGLLTAVRKTIDLECLFEVKDILMRYIWTIIKHLLLKTFILIEVSWNMRNDKKSHLVLLLCLLSASTACRWAKFYTNLKKLHASRINLSFSKFLLLGDFCMLEEEKYLWIIICIDDI